MRLVNNETIDSDKITEDFKVGGGVTPIYPHSRQDTLDHYLEDYVADELPDADWLYDDLHLGDLAEIGAI